MSPCEQFPELLRLRDAGDTDAIEALLRACPECATAWRELEALTALGQALPSHAPTDARRESVRTRILAQVEAPPARRHGLVWTAAAALLLIAVAGWSLWSPQGAQDPVWAQVTPAPGADFQRQRTAAVETVVLRDGVIAVYVSPRSTDTQVRILTADAELFVRGTRFSVAADAGRLTRVEVISGQVELRPRGRPTVQLADGARWDAESVAEVVAPKVPSPVPEPVDKGAMEPAEARVEAPRTAVSPTRSRPTGVSGTSAGATPKSTPAPPTEAPVPPTAPPAPEERAVSAQTQRFDAGWTALRTGRHTTAVDAFTAAAELPGPLVADAHWWRAVALGRAGRDIEAQSALERYLSTYPRSARRAEASVMLGWLHFASGRMDAAEKAFRGGLDAAKPAVRSRAAEGAAAVEAWRKKTR